jgi:hypothetical protein
LSAGFTAFVVGAVAEAFCTASPALEIAVLLLGDGDGAGRSLLLAFPRGDEPPAGVEP